MRFSKLECPHPHIDVSDSLRVFILEVQAYSQRTDSATKYQNMATSSTEAHLFFTNILL
jgi:hypothetical protein